MASLLGGALPARAQPAPVLRAAQVPAAGTRPADFVPRGWKLAGDLQGDLTGDGKRDHVLYLVSRETLTERSGTDPAPEAHGLVVVTADRGKLRRAGVGGELLVRFAPQYSVDFAIRKGVLVVKQDYGMSEVVNLTHRFRYEPSTRRFLLIGKDIFTYTRPLRGDTINRSENYLTGVRLVTTGQFQDGTVGEEVAKREKIRRARTYLEAVDENFDD